MNINNQNETYVNRSPALQGIGVCFQALSNYQNLKNFNR
jgi:hypothetical protein